MLVPTQKIDTASTAISTLSAKIHVRFRLRLKQGTKLALFEGIGMLCLLAKRILEFYLRSGNCYGRCKIGNWTL